MLYKEILTQALSSTILKDENLQAIAAQLIHDTCCQAVLEIQAILADDTRTDKDCFYQIEKIVCALQDKGISCGNRHEKGKKNKTRLSSQIAPHAKTRGSERPPSSKKGCTLF